MGKASPFWQAAGAGRFAIPLPGGRVVTAVIERTEWRGDERFVSRGRLEGHEGSAALLAYCRGAVSGFLSAGDLGEFQLNGSLARREVTVTATGGLDCAGGIAAPPRVRAMPTAAANQPEAVPGTGATTEAPAPLTIDVLGVFVADAFGPGTTDEIAKSNFDLNIELCNLIYANSQIPLRLRLVGVAQTNYVETKAGDPMRVIGDALEALRLRGDRQMDEVHALRDEVGADLVFLVLPRFAPGAGGPSGMSYIQFHPSVSTAQDWEANPDYGFCVVKGRSDNNISALPHEIGHNFGCAHDRPNAGTSGGAFPDSHGYKFTGRNGRVYRTIMAIGTESSALRFSNPRVVPPEFGVPVGVPAGAPDAADNARTIERAMFEIAAFRMTKEAPTENRLLNVATRAWVGEGAGALIGGFIIAGSGQAGVVVRGLGPSLERFGLADVLTNPVVEVRRTADGTLVVRNDDWSEGSEESRNGLARSGLAPGSGREPAVHLTLPAGGYSVLVSAADERAGHAIVEVFGLGGGARLANLSTRAFVGGEGREMIGGFVIDGAPGETKRVVIRVLGPSLRNYGVSAAMDDPAIELHAADGSLLLVQDDFMAIDPAAAGVAVRSTYAQAKIFEAGLQPGNRREPCVMLDLAAGAYSVVVKPANGTAPGSGLLEVFEVNDRP